MEKEKRERVDVERRGEFSAVYDKEGEWAALGEQEKAEAEKLAEELNAHFKTDFKAVFIHDAILTPKKDRLMEKAEAGQAPRFFFCTQIKFRNIYMEFN